MVLNTRWASVYVSRLDEADLACFLRLMLRTLEFGTGGQSLTSSPRRPTGEPYRLSGLPSLTGRTG